MKTTETPNMFTTIFGNEIPEIETVKEKAVKDAAFWQKLKNKKAKKEAEKEKEAKAKAKAKEAKAEAKKENKAIDWVELADHSKNLSREDLEKYISIGKKSFLKNLNASCLSKLRRELSSRKKGEEATASTPIIVIDGIVLPEIEEADSVYASEFGGIEVGAILSYDLEEA